jgi:hypothetical protein
MSKKDRQGLITVILITICLTFALWDNSIAAAICFCGLIYDFHQERW